MATHEKEQQHRPPVETEDMGDGYEKRDVNLLMITVMAIGFSIVIAIFGILLNEYFLITRDRLIEREVLGKPSQKLLDMRAADQQRLSSYGVSEDQEGVYRIPIERAMELIAERNTNPAD